MAVEYSSGTLGLVPATGQPDALAVVHGGPGSGSQLGEPTFSPDGSAIATSDDLGLIHLVNVPDRRLAGILTAENIYNNKSMMNGIFSKEIDTVIFSPDSKRVACGTESGIVRVWDVATGRSVSSFSVSGSASGGADARPVKTLVFSPDGKTLVTSDDADSTLAVWDVASGRKVATLNAGTGDVVSAAFTADGKLVVATTSSSVSSQRIEVWATSAGLGG
jgi:WD40 repeat protein